MGHIADLRRRAQRSTSNFYDTLFTRRVSIYLTAALHPLGVSANTVSALNCVVAVAACAGIGLGTGWQVMLGVALVHLFAVLDSVDGELARLTQRYSLAGLFLEDLAAYTMINGVWLALGAYLSRTTATTWPLVVAVAIVAFGRNAMQVARRAILKSVATRRPIDPAFAASLARRGAPRSARIRTFVEKHLLHYTNVWVVTTTLIVVEQLGGSGGRSLVLPAFVAYAGLVTVKELVAITLLVCGDGLDRQLVDVYAKAQAVPSAPVSGIALAGDA